MKNRLCSICATFTNLVLFALGLMGASAHAQSAVVGKGCNLSVFGEKNTKQFLAFDHDLREALERQDIGKLALLVQYPFRMSDDRGSIFIEDASSLQGYFDKVFPLAIRQAVLSTAIDDVWCNYTGISYGKGDVWVNVTDQGYFLMTVNLPISQSNRPAPVRTLDIACHTKDRRVLIDSTADHVPRLRLWSFMSALSGPPNVEIEAGKASFEGTGPCAHPLWDFQNDKMKVHLEGIGCWGDDDRPPEHAQAEFSITEGSDLKPNHSWCF